MPLLCGNDVECYTSRYMSNSKLKIASDKTKRRLLIDYSLVALADPLHLKKSFILLGKMFPEYMDGVENVLKYQADSLSKVRLDTMAINKTRVLPETREKLSTGIFRWDMDLYHFVQMGTYFNAWVCIMN